jgi:hypothetical protein
MPPNLRRASVCIALVALLLRALVPVGWMPNPAGTAGVPIILCTAEGWISVFVGSNGQPVKQSPADDRSQQSDGCPFATAPHLATPTAVIASTQRSLVFSRTEFDTAQYFGLSSRQFSPASPRAPPSAL